MASHFGRSRHLEDPKALFEDREASPTSPLCSSATWWADREEHTDGGETLREQLKAMDDHVANLQEMLKWERTRSSRLQLRCNQQEAELRRREQNMNRMKERLSLSTDRHKDRPSSIKILNVLSSARGKREQPSAKKLGEEAVRLMLDRREAELREAMKLRHSLTSILHALRCDMEQTLSEIELENCENKPEPVDKLDQTEQALGDHVTGGVVQGWRKVQKKLGMFTSEGAFGTDQDKLMAQLERDLKQSQQLVQMQQLLLQDAIGSSVPSELDDCYFAEEWERLREQWAMLERQRKTFERERGAFTDAAIRLSRERISVEQLKASLLKQQFLGDCSLFDEDARSNTKSHMTLSLGADGYSRSVRAQTNTPELSSVLRPSCVPWRGAEDHQNKRARTALDCSF